MDEAEFFKKVAIEKKKLKTELKLPSVSLDVDSLGQLDKACCIYFGQEVINYSNPWDAIKAARSVIRSAKYLIPKLEKDIERVQFLTS